MSKRTCVKNCKKPNGNCHINCDDGLPVQCVGKWVKDKHYFLQRFLDISKEARKKFYSKGNAVFIDLFSGPGKCIIEKEQTVIDSGVLKVSKLSIPFNEHICVDIEKENIDALKKRIDKNYLFQCCDSNHLIKDIVKELLKKPYRYHFAYLDPFAPKALKFSTIKELAKCKKMDMLIHFPIGAILRNIPHWLKKNEQKILDDFLGTNTWQEKMKLIPQSQKPKTLLEIFKNQLKKIGYTETGLKISENYTTQNMSAVSVKNQKNVDLYYLILISKHPLGQKMCNSTTKKDSRGQPDFNF